jgi:hypothetical protein
VIFEASLEFQIVGGEEEVLMRVGEERASIGEGYIGIALTVILMIQIPRFFSFRRTT